MKGKISASSAPFTQNFFRSSAKKKCPPSTFLPGIVILLLITRNYVVKYGASSWHEPTNTGGWCPGYCWHCKLLHCTPGMRSSWQPKTGPREACELYRQTA